MFQSQENWTPRIIPRIQKSHWLLTLIILSWAWILGEKIGTKRGTDLSGVLLWVTGKIRRIDDKGGGEMHRRSALNSVIAAPERAHLAKLLTSKRHKTATKPTKQMDTLPLCRQFSAGYTVLSLFSRSTRGRREAHVTLSPGKRKCQGSSSTCPSPIYPCNPLSAPCCINSKGWGNAAFCLCPRVPLVKAQEGNGEQPLSLQRRSSVHQREGGNASRGLHHPSHMP